MRKHVSAEIKIDRSIEKERKKEGKEKREEKKKREREINHVDDLDDEACCPSDNNLT